MQEGKLKYKRLQIGHIWLRTVIEIVLIIAAIVVCSYLTVRSYENTFYEATKDSARESTQQLSHSVSGAVDPELLEITDPKREAYVRDYYSELFNACFTDGSILNSCAVYRVSGSDAVFFASCDGYDLSDIDEKKLSEFSMVFGNIGFLGLPILDSLFGDKGVFMGAFFVASFNVLIWTLGIVILAKGRDDIKVTVKKIFLNYGTVPCAIGLLLFVLNFKLPDFFFH